MEKIKCPNCGEKCEEVLQAQKGTLYYRYNLKTKESESDEHRADSVEGYICTECGEDFDAKTMSEIDEYLNG